MEKPRVGVSAIIKKNGKYLLGKRKGSHGDGTWSFPGGHLEAGETILACALREILEETGLGVRIGSVKVEHVTEDFFVDEGLHYITLFVTVNVVGDPINMEPKKCDGWEWFDRDKFPSPLFLPIENLIEKGAI